MHDLLPGVLSHASDELKCILCPGTAYLLAAGGHELHSHQVQGKYVVGPFTDKARIADYIKEQHQGMISIFPAMGGFYTVFAGMPHFRPRYCLFSSCQLPNY